MIESGRKYVGETRAFTLVASANVTSHNNPSSSGTAFLSSSILDNFNYVASCFDYFCVRSNNLSLN